MHKHVKIYKPDGYLSQFINNSKRRKNKRLLGELYDFPEGMMSIGRLDEMSEGLLLLTTNGKASALITSTKFEKEYYVQVDGIITPQAIALLQSGVEISVYGKPYMTKPCKAHILEQTPNFKERRFPIRDARHGPTSWMSITITEGKFRQVRKMTAKVGFPTLRLVRVRIGTYTLGHMKPGDVEFIDIET